MPQPRRDEEQASVAEDGTTEKLLPQNGLKAEVHKAGHREEMSATVTFDEALDQTGFGKFNYFIMLVSGLVLGNVLVETSGVGFILPVAQCDLKLSNQDKGLLSAMGYLGIILSSHLWGFLADTKGRRRVIRPTLLVAFLFTLASTFAHEFWLMAVLRFANGFFVSGGSATIYAYLGEFHAEKTRSRAMMGAAFIFALGAMIVPVIAFLVINRDWIVAMPLLGIDYKPWRLFLLVCGLPGLVSGLALYALPESPKFLLAIGREAEAMEVLQQMHRWNGQRTPLKFGHILPEDEDAAAAGEEPRAVPAKRSNICVHFLQTMWRQTVPLFGRKYLRVTLIVCTTQFWLYVATNGLYMWFPHIANSIIEYMNAQPGEHKQICEIIHDKHLSTYREDGTIVCMSKLETQTYYYSFLIEITYAVSFAVIGLIINKVGKIPVIFATTVFFSVCGIVSAFVSDPTVAIYLYLLIFLEGVPINVLGAVTVDLYPTNLRGMAICISLMVGRLGSVVGANIAGALLGNHCDWTIHITCVALIVCAFLCLLLPRKRTPTEQQAAGECNS